MAETGWPLIPREVLPAPVPPAQRAPPRRAAATVPAGRQLSIFGAETADPSLADLAGLLAGPGPARPDGRHGPRLGPGRRRLAGARAGRRAGRAGPGRSTGARCPDGPGSADRGADSVPSRRPWPRVTEEHSSEPPEEDPGTTSRVKGRRRLRRTGRFRGAYGVQQQVERSGPRLAAAGRRRALPRRAAAAAVGRRGRRAAARRVTRSVWIPTGSLTRGRRRADPGRSGGHACQAGPAYVIAGRRRLARLAELVGERPAAAPERLWPGGAAA